MSSPAEHVRDSTYFELPGTFFGGKPCEIHLPEILGLQLTKYMVLEVIVAVILIAIFTIYAKKIKGGALPKGRFWNMTEILLLYIRDNVARPAMGGKHHADKFMPYFWTVFFFVLGCNLIGLVPWCGSPTGSIAVTAGLALCTFTIGVVAGSKEKGLFGFWTGLVPHIDLPIYMLIVLWPILFAIELISLFIKHGVLAIRLLMNMFAGHLVLAVFMSFIAASAVYGMKTWAMVTTLSLGMCLFLCLLELLVALLQAYLFTFLSALFIGMVIHEH